MRADWKLIAACSLMTLSGCDSAVHKESNHPAASQAHFDEVKFRAAARGMYKGLLTPSCKPDPKLARSVVLADETAAVAALETRLPATASAYQLRITREDVEQDSLGCWADDDPAFARKHIEMARKEARTGLQEVERLASSAPPTPTDVADSRLPKSAAYRALVRTVVSDLSPLCELTNAGSNDQILVPARLALNRYKVGVRSTRYARQFTIAEADAVEVQKGVVAECMEPRDEAPAKLSAAVLSQIERSIKQMDAIARPDRKSL